MITISVTAARPPKQAKDLAAVVVDGRRYEARSNSGAIFALCRVLVAAGVADQPWQSINTAATDVVSMRGPSVHGAAGLTVEERDAGGMRFGRFAPRPETAAHSITGRSPMRAEPSDAPEGGGGGLRLPGASTPMEMESA